MHGESFAWHPEPELLDYLDPLVARDALRTLGRTAWDLALDYFYEEVIRRSVGSDSYVELRERFFGSVGDESRQRSHSPPSEGVSSDELLTEVRERLLPFQHNAGNPRSFSYFTPGPLPISVAGEVIAQWMNQSVDVWHTAPSASLVEEEVVAWLRELVGFDEEGFGVLTSGGSMANLMALAVAREVHLPRVRGREGTRGPALEDVRVYTSDQAHFSIGRSLDLLGFPPDTLHVVPTDDRFRLHGEAVADAIATDRAAGFTPLAVAAVAGSTNTGSVDLIRELAELARAEGIWLHVDAAYGAAARLSRRDASRVPGLELADSVTVDPHKWFFQPIDIGALVVRQRTDLLRTFHRSPDYYRANRPEDEPLNWYQYSMEGTRRFRGLKLWLSWKHLGTEGFGRLVERTNDLAAYMAEQGRTRSGFELCPKEPELSVVCFRHLPRSPRQGSPIEPERLDRYQNQLQRRLELSGEAWVSTTRLNGRVYLRAGFVNYYSTPADIDHLLDALERLSPIAAGEAGISTQ